MSVGGSVLEMIIGGRLFQVAADADGSRDLGGYTSEYSPNGNGSARKLMTRKVWKLGGLSLEIDDERGDQEYLQDIVDSPDNVDISATMVSGITWAGKGSPTGDFGMSTANATAPLEFSGPGKLKQQ